MEKLRSCFAKVEIEEINLGDRTKLCTRGCALLLELIKSKSLKIVSYGDCTLTEIQLDQMKDLMTSKTDGLVFRQHATLGLEGCVLMKNLLRKHPIKSIVIWECTLTPNQLVHILDGLNSMSINMMNSIKLRDVTLSREGCELLKNIIISKEIKSLDLSHCFLQSSHLEYLIGAIQNISYVMESLILRGNLMSKRDVDKLKKLIKHKVTEITF